MALRVGARGPGARVVKWSERPFRAEWEHGGVTTTHVADGAVAQRLRDWGARQKVLTRAAAEMELQRQRARGGAVGEQAHATLVSLFCYAQQLRDALHFFDRAQADWPTALAPVVPLLRYYAAAGDARNVVKLLQQLHEAGHALTDPLVRVVVKLCAARRWGRLAAAAAREAQEVTGGMAAHVITALDCVDRAEVLLGLPFSGTQRWAAYFDLSRRHGDAAAAARCLLHLLRADDGAASAPLIDAGVATFLDVCREAHRTRDDAVGLLTLCVDLWRRAPALRRALAVPMLRACAELRSDAALALADEVFATSSGAAPQEAAVVAMLGVHACRGDLRAAEALFEKSSRSARVRKAYASACRAFRARRAGQFGV